jgi:Ulp1 family protease
MAIAMPILFRQHHMVAVYRPQTRIIEVFDSLAAENATLHIEVESALLR